MGVRTCENSARNEPPLPEVLAYFLTWATYGTWLPGDERGWVEYRRGWQLPDPVRKLEAQARMTEDACRLDAEQRDVVHRQIAETCKIRGWQLHAVNCRSNHLHVVLTADREPEIVRSSKRGAPDGSKNWRRKTNRRPRQGNGNSGEPVGRCSRAAKDSSMTKKACTLPSSTLMDGEDSPH